jgi:hypothetical protein
MGNATVEKARVRKWQQLVGLAVLAVGWCGLGVYKWRSATEPSGAATRCAPIE